MLSADNAEPSSNSVNPPPGAQLLALALRPPSDPGPGRRDFEPRIRDFLHRARRPATVLVSPMPHERRSLPPLFSLAPTKSSDSRSPRRPARSHLEDLPDSPTPPGTFPLAPRRVTRARNRGRADNVPARATRPRGAGRDRHWNDHAADRRGRQLSLHGNPGHGSARSVSRPPMRRPSRRLPRVDVNLVSPISASPGLPLQPRSAFPVAEASSRIASLISILNFVGHEVSVRLYAHPLGRPLTSIVTVPPPW
jgi:hypothetical protein